MRSLLLLFLLLTACGPAAQAATYAFDYNIRCRQAYEAYLSLRPEEGDAWIRKEFSTNPYNLMATYLADYGDFMWLFFNGDPAEMRQRQDHQSERLALLDRAPDNEPWKRFCKAGIYMHWAIIHGRMGENFKAALTFRKSYILIKENKERFPDFAPNDLFLGLEEAFAGTIPDEYKWLASIFGMKGNVRRGAARLSGYLSQPGQEAAPLRQEAVIYDLYIRFYLLYRQQEVWRSISSKSFTENSLTSFVYANLSLNYRKAGAALPVLKEVAQTSVYQRFPVFQYELANAYYLLLDHSCLAHFQQFVARNKGRLYSKDALMKSALFAYLDGNNAQAIALRSAIRTAGSTLTDADKQAQRFAEGTAWPNKPLLRARIETDAGEYATALAHLKTISPQAFADPADRLEYTYRLARAYEGTGDLPHAIQYYLQTLREGAGRKEQFAARASLQLGMLYEQAGQAAVALRYFNQCLKMRGHDFQSSIDQQAKAGLNRNSTK